MKKSKRIFLIRANTDATITMATASKVWHMFLPLTEQDIKIAIKDIYDLDNTNFSFENLYKLLKKGYSIQIDAGKNQMQLIIAYHHLVMAYNFEKSEDILEILSKAERCAKNFNNLKNLEL